jgi:acyl-CoA synthetase (AMP-forming)/AMP-acid ligase II
LDPAALLLALKGQLAGFKVPKVCKLLDELPRNAMGKVQKNVLRQQLGSDSNYSAKAFSITSPNSMTAKA